jgi:restriction endonuclease S subunit
MELKKYKKKRIIPQGWKEISIADAFRTSSGATPLSTETSYYDKGTIPWVNSGELSSPYIYQTTNYISQKGFDNSSTEMYPVNTVLVAMYGATAGKASLLKLEACTNQAICAILPNKDYSSTFLKYSIDTLYDHLVGLSSGSARDNLSQTELKKLKLIMPTIKEQQEKLVAILALIDRKIELNRAINQNLEAMAKQLYDYWFVQFDFPNEEGKPYKSSGGEMLWNDKLKRNIPVGWHCGNLFEIAVFTNGLACQKFRPKDDEVPLPVIKIREMHDGISVDTEEVTSNIPESVKVYNGDVLFSWSASLEVMLWAYGLGGLNQHIFKVTSANDFPKSFYYFQLLDYVDVFKKMAEARKTTMGHITQDHLQQSTIAIPDNKDVADKFEKLISPIFKQIVKLQEEISNLIKQRDELLPLLMNGQITIE